VPYANETHAVFDAGGDSTPMYLAPLAGEFVDEPPADLKGSGVDLDLLVNAAQPAFRRFALESIPVIVAKPDFVATDPSLAAKILVQGMRDGSFTGKKLIDYFRSGEEPDFFNARAMINSDKRKNGERISGYARQHLAAMTGSSDPG